MPPRFPWRYALSSPETAQIVLLDAPAVLGWVTYRELDARYGLGAVRLGLRRAIETGAVRDVPVETTVMRSPDEHAVEVVGLG